MSALINLKVGAMYRAVCLYCLQEGIMVDGVIDEARLLSVLDSIGVSFKYNSSKNASETILNGVNVEQDIRGLWVSDNVSKVSKLKAVRKKMVYIQQEIGVAKGVVMDGRDIGTKVFPDARLKLFVTASSEIRAQRRYDELVKKEEGITYKEVLGNLTQRDNHDMNREINPLLQAKDAILIDNSELSIKTQNDLINNLIETKLG